MTYPDFPTGHRFGKCTVIKRLHDSFTKDRRGYPRKVQNWLVKCDCGTIFEATRSMITGKQTNMCAACQADRRRVYGAKSPTSNKFSLPSNPENAQRGTVAGFKKYFRANQLMFQDTFKRPYSDEAAHEEFEKVGIGG